MKQLQLTTYIIISIALLSACKNASKEDKKEASETIPTTVSLTQEQEKNAGIATDTLKTQVMATTIKVTGKIDVPPQNMVSVSAPMGGFLRSTKLLPGMHLNKGEVIAIMEDQQYVQLQQDFLTTKYELEFAEKDYLRQKELSESKAASDKVYEQAKANHFTLKTKYLALAEKLKLIGINPYKLNENSISGSIQIVSPITGYVSQVKVNIGKYIQASEILFELVNPEDIHLNMTVFEKDIKFLSIGQKVNAFNNSEPNKIYPCEIILIGQDVSADRHIEVHCHFEKYDRSLIPGMYMNAIIESDAAPTKVVPEAAIVGFAGKSYCFVKTKDLEYKMTEITVGQIENGMAEVINFENLKNQLVVVEGAYALLMKLKNTEEE